jgi:hypothetical protein
MLFCYDGYGARDSEPVDTHGVATSHSISPNDDCEYHLCTKIHSVGWKMQGDTTFISWLMVMTRKYVLPPSPLIPDTNIDFRHYFRSHCRYVATRRPQHRRSRASLLASISPPVKAFQNQEVVPPRKVSPISEVEITRGSIADDIIIEKESQEQPAYESSNPDERNVANAVMFLDSPSPLGVPLPSSHHSLAEAASGTSPNFLQQRRVLTFRGKGSL